MSDIEDLKDSEDLKDIDDSEEGGAKHSNLYEVNFMLWFEIGIEGKDPMDNNEDDWGGNLEFGFDDTNFSTNIEDYFMMF